MRFLDALLGRSKPAPPKLDALFALPSAAVTLEAGLGLAPAAAAAVCFRPATGASFDETRQEISELLAMNAAQAGSQVGQQDDSYGYHWVVVRDPDLEDLVTSVHMVNSTLEERGFGPQLLASVFPFTDPSARVVHLIYQYKRGTFYPFAPSGPERRDNQFELKVRATLGADLPVEADLTRWFPIWGVPVP